MENTEEKKAPMGKIPVPSEKLKALQAAMDKIEKNYGKGAIMKILVTLTSVEIEAWSVPGIQRAS